MTAFAKKYEALGVQVPFTDPKPEIDTKLHFQFIPPTSVYIVGSFLLKTIIKSPSGVTVDLAFEMPKVINILKIFTY